MNAHVVLLFSLKPSVRLPVAAGAAAAHRRRRCLSLSDGAPCSPLDLIVDFRRSTTMTTIVRPGHCRAAAVECR